MILVLKKGPILLALLCVAVLVAVPLMLTQNAGIASVSATVTNWGLSFQTAGQPPVGNATAEYLAQYNAHYLGETATEVGKKLYLTFDAGFENGNTEPILDTLKKHNVKACFFLVKNYLDTSPELVKRMVEEGHTIGNHTATHPDMSKIADRAAFEKELKSLEEAYAAITGQEMEKLYRPPQGKYSEQNLKMAQEMGYHTFFWSLAYVEWYVDDQPSREQAFDKLLPRIHPGAIVLLHSTSATNAAILDELLTKWESMGYTFGTLQELM
ncbi:MAG: polysaccharide deacetylase family protein [Clostridia bacterium]|nr:polysaccharide deacetylase family protein [Clostridia bacterium]